MEIICPHDKCTGCSACYSSCPYEAINMSEDECGFTYPEITQELCVDCGLCAKVCPVNGTINQHFPVACYAATSKNKTDLETCASGGLATVLSRYVISKGGVVYGCSGKDMRNVRHIRVDSEDGLNFLKRSKYVQSYIGSIFKSVKNDLNIFPIVLFIGTPCQVAGLHGYLRHKDYPNLITVDLVCHGVPSQKMLDDNISLYTLENTDVNVEFRRKIVKNKPNSVNRIVYGWLFQTGHTPKPLWRQYYKDPYMFGFLSSLIFRRSCYDCRYACIARCGDFTLCDFWGLAIDSGFDVGKGCSAVLLNTEKAKQIWKHIAEKCDYTEREVVEAWKGNGQLQRPSTMHPNYEKFRSLYQAKGFKKAVYISLRKDIVKLVLENIKKFIRNLWK